MTASDTIRVGIVGTGRWAEEVHAPGVVSHPQGELIAVCSRTRENVEAMAKRFDVPHALTDYQDLVALDGLDAVIVCTPHATHHPVCMAAIDRGLHVFCEKPLGVTLAEARETAAAAEAAGIKHMVAFTCRWLPHALYVKRMLDEGALGPIYHATVLKMAGYAGASSVRKWRFHKPLSGGGVMADLGVHVIDLARWYLGEIRSVCAHAPTMIHERRDPNNEEMLPCEVEDAAGFLAEFESGAQGVFHISWIAHRGHDQTITLCGEKGTIVYQTSPEAWRHSLQVSGVPDDTLAEVEPPADLMGTIDGSNPKAGWRSFVESYPSMARRFIDTIVHDEPPLPSFVEGLRAQEVFEAVMTSHRERRWVDVPLAE